MASRAVMTTRGDGSVKAVKTDWKAEGKAGERKMSEGAESIRVKARWV